MVRCLLRGCDGGLNPLKTWKFRFYEVKCLECPKCHGVFNHYQGLSPAGKRSEFVIRVKPRIRGG